MEILLIVILSVVVAAALVGGLGAGIYVARRQGADARRSAQAEREAAVDAAVRAVLAESDRVVHAAIEATVELADAKLDGRLRAQGGAMHEKLSGMGAELQRVGNLVAELQRERGDQHREFVVRLEQAAQTTRQLADSTQDLRAALANPKARGTWGERMAEDVLRAAGFQEGISYVKQRSTGAGIPDFTFPLPNDLVLHMDAKFPANNYLRYLEADRDDERKAHESAFVRDVRTRIKELAGREYTGTNTVDYVLLFIPNESVYAFIGEHDPEVIDVALANKVILCSPFTLFAVLAVIRQSVENFALERTSDEILECLGRFGGQWRKFTDQLARADRQLETFEKSFSQLKSTRRNMLERELEKIDELRASRGLVAADEPLATGDVPLREVSAG